MARNFMELLQKKWGEGRFVCVGLDPDWKKIPDRFKQNQNFGAYDNHWFLVEIVRATHGIVCAFKPNIAFFEKYGGGGINHLRDLIAFVHDIAPEVPVILDAKRADIGNTNNGYVGMLDDLGADAITVHSYLGAEALKPFLDREDKGVIVLCRTSNPGAGEFQDLMVFEKGTSSSYAEPLYLRVAERVSREWNKNGNCALVVGATYPDELQKVREVVGDMPLLIPGVGFQQKGVPLEEQVNQVVNAGKNSCNQGMIINSSRGIIFASNGEDFAEAASRETQKLHDLIAESLAAAMEVEK